MTVFVLARGRAADLQPIEMRNRLNWSERSRDQGGRDLVKPGSQRRRDYRVADNSGSPALITRFAVKKNGFISPALLAKAYFCFASHLSNCAISFFCDEMICLDMVFISGDLPCANCISAMFKAC